MFARVREWAGVTKTGEQSGLAELFSCVWCMSVWVASALYIVFFLIPVICYVLALSAVAIVFEKLVRAQDL